MKKCKKCKKSEDLNCFTKSTESKDGYFRYCKDCKSRLQTEYNQTPKGKFIVYKNNARSRGYDFDLTFEEFKSFWNKDCYYCGDEIEGIGLDRIKNSIGYKVYNIVACCKTCNMMKWILSADSFISHCKKVIKFQNKKSLVSVGLKIMDMRTFEVRPH